MAVSDGVSQSPKGRSRSRLRPPINPPVATNLCRSSAAEVGVTWRPLLMLLRRTWTARTRGPKSCAATHPSGAEQSAAAVVVSGAACRWTRRWNVETTSDDTPWYATSSTCPWWKTSNAAASCSSSSWYSYGSF